MKMDLSDAREWLNVILVGSVAMFFPLAVFLAIMGS